MAELLTLRDIARQTGLNVRILRYHREHGHLFPVESTPYRGAVSTLLFTQAEIDRFMLWRNEAMRHVKPSHGR